MLEVNLDISGILEKNKELADKIAAKAQELTTVLTLQTYDFVIQEAQTKLHSRRQQFIDNWQHEQLDADTHELKILAPAVWIDEGLPQDFDMLPGLLRSPKAKNGPNGKYIVVPFKHNKGPATQTPTQKVLANIIKKEFKKKNIPFAKIEQNADGSPKSGLLHKMNITQPKKAPDGKSLESTTGGLTRHFLEGLRVYQKATANNKTQKDVMTFRTASEKHSGQKWIHPGTAPMNFLQSAKDFAEKTWEEQLLPQLLSDLGLNE